jgi:hypothetical protein
MVRLSDVQMTRIRTIARSGLLGMIGLSTPFVAPCMAQLPDPFRSAPPPAPDSFRSAPAAAPVKPVARTRPPRPAREAEPFPEPVLASPNLGTAVAPSGPPTPSVAKPAGPPLEVNVAGMSEDGANHLVVVYHGDGTFDMLSKSAGGFGPESKNKGVWWWDKNSRFCFRLSSGATAGKDQCKSNGHLIGRVDPSGRAIPRAHQ